MNKVGLDTHPELINFRNNEKRKIYNGHYSYPYKMMYEMCMI
jgi:hypothetical protein